jgi:hypothetical protein
VVSLTAWLVPSDRRARWREEWLAELNAGTRGLHRAFGAPVDAIALRRAARPPRGAWRATLRGDLLHTARVLGREPGHTITVTLCLGVGIAVAVTTSSVMNGMPQPASTR